MSATLTKAQITTLHNFCTSSADPVMVDIVQRGATVDLSNYMNNANTTGVVAWNNSVPATVLDGAANYTTYDSLTQGKRDEWSIFLQYAPRDMSKSSNEKVVTDVWGVASTGSLAESILLATVYTATVAQAVIGGSSRTQGSVTATNLTYFGIVSQTDAQNILKG